jgi:hypothetical protein
MEIIKFSSGDTLILKKNHPCGSDSFTVLRGGSDVRLICNGCKRDMTLDRVKLERSVKKVITKEI